MELKAHILTLDKPFTSDAYTLRNAVLEQYAGSDFCSYIDGELRKKVIYPRIHFTLVDDKPVVVGMKEAMDTTDAFVETLKKIRIHGEEWTVQSVESSHDCTYFDKTGIWYTYRFLTPWVGLNRQNLIRYKYLYAAERTAFLNKMLSQNIVFLMKEFEYSPRFKISCRIRINGLNPTVHPEIGMGYFTGEFQSNVYLPEYLAMGCGISRGFGTITCIDKSRNTRHKPDISTD
ncbi:MAG: hypothetical protein PWP06_971 [Candidatus Marinimicrobia bacterium]|jgi:hypothetical protein|nr:hypothetical protein [Candidatus Neomarinimicrobiota bacterium]